MSERLKYKTIRIGTSIFYKTYNEVFAELREDGTIIPNDKTIDNLLNFNLKNDRITGLYPEEVIAKFRSIPGTDSSRIAIIDNIFDLDRLPNTSNSDFMIAPIYKNGHFVSAIVHFVNPSENNGIDREIFVFDSQQENDIPYINKSDGLKSDPKLLNKINLQGNSGTCGYFTAEFISLASRFKSFEALRNNCINVGRVQKYIYEKVNETLKRNDKYLNQLHGSYDNLVCTFNRLGNSVGYGKKYDTKQSKSQPNLKLYYWRNKIRKNKSVPDILRIK